MTGDNNKNGNDQYDRRTLIMAGGIFIGFCLVTYFLPKIMSTVGTRNPYITGGIIAVFLIVPFIGLWWRGRVKSKRDQ